MWGEGRKEDFYFVPVNVFPHNLLRKYYKMEVCICISGTHDSNINLSLLIKRQRIQISMYGYLVYRIKLSKQFNQQTFFFKTFIPFDF